MRTLMLLASAAFATTAFADDDCNTNPNGYNCPQSPDYCSRNPYDPTCAPGGNHCNTNPYDPSCGPNGGYCQTHSYDPACGPSGAYCQRNPYDAACRHDDPTPPPPVSDDGPDPTPEEWARFCEKYPFMTECRSPGFGPSPREPTPAPKPEPKPVQPRSDFSSADSAWFLQTISSLMNPRSDGVYVLAKMSCWKKFLGHECEAFAPTDRPARMQRAFTLSSSAAKRAREILRQHSYEEENWFGRDYRKGFTVRDIVCADGRCSVERSR